VRVMVPGGRDAGAFEGTEPRSIVAHEGESDCQTFLPRGSANTVSDAVAIGFSGGVRADPRQVRRASGMWAVREAFRALAPQVQAASESITRGPPRGGIDRRLWAHATAKPPGDVMGIDRVVVGLAPREGLHVAGMPADKRQTVCRTNVSTPVPGEQTCGSDDELLARGGDGLEKGRRWGCM
jgi:hypothetical protein